MKRIPEEFASIVTVSFKLESACDTTLERACVPNTWLLLQVRILACGRISSPWSGRQACRTLSRELSNNVVVCMLGGSICLTQPFAKLLKGWKLLFPNHIQLLPSKQSLKAHLNVFRKLCKMHCFESYIIVFQFLIQELFLFMVCILSFFL